ncbi:DNA ligase-1 [Alicyclobacillus macrosporangiidus]|uniref:DNA ligase-1 n=1 Tax=Alicyclobacillus macrosporangiidus TaxID=392015 RepID=A0A1I7L2P2_9BACL|nr:DNA ligase-1 [Alicyclobacillus macrosporangiidus]
MLDGEMIVLDQGKLCFESVIRRLRAQSESTIRRLSQTMPAHFVAFDVLSVDGQDVTRRLLEERLELLERVVQPSEYISVCKTFDDGSALFHAVAKMGLEGIVSKRLGSRYVVGVRSMDWLKVKHYQYRVVDIIGIRKGEFGWLLGDGGQPLGVLEFAPPVARKALIQYARTKALVYTENKHWLFIQPVRCKVKFQSYTKNGLLRSASFVHFVV